MRAAWVRIQLNRSFKDPSDNQAKAVLKGGRRGVPLFYPYTTAHFTSVAGSLGRTTAAFRAYIATQLWGLCGGDCCYAGDLTDRRHQLGFGASRPTRDLA